jgi:hypothetical protein
MVLETAFGLELRLPYGEDLMRSQLFRLQLRLTFT